VSERDKLAAWIISAAGPECTHCFEAPIEVPGWDKPPWVELRALSQREQLERESQGIRDEYHLDDSGCVDSIERNYDLVAVTAYDYEHCLVDFCLPRENDDGEIVPWRKPNNFRAAQLLDNLPPALAQWLSELIEQVNMRDPTGQQVLGAVKKI